MLYFTNGTSSSLLRHAVLEGGGNKNWPEGQPHQLDDRGAVDVEGGKLELQYVAIQNAGWNSGIYSENGDISGNDVGISGGEYGIYVKSGACPDLVNVSMSGSKGDLKGVSCAFPSE